MYDFENVIEEIEKHITSDIDMVALAKMLNMSVYEFRRVFTFVTKISLGEYIRKRRLSLVAAELYSSHESITYYAKKYGYDSPSSFSRAFREFHGVTPSDVKNGNSNFRMFTKMSAELSCQGGEEVSYAIIDKEAYCISGISGRSTLLDTECCEDMWEAFYASDIAKQLESEGTEIYAAYENDPSGVNCLIGTSRERFADKMYIPASQWAIFKFRGTEDSIVNEFYSHIVSRYIASVGFERNEKLPNVEVFPFDMSADNFEWEIHIPIRKTNRRG